MRFCKEALFKELVAKHGINLYLGDGFSVYARNDDGESLPLGNRINDKLIELFELDKTRGFNLSKTCQKIKKDSEDLLEKVLKDTYSVCDYDNIYLELTKMPIKNIVSTNIDDLVEQIYGSRESKVRVSDSKIYGTLEKENMVNLYVNAPKQGVVISSPMCVNLSENRISGGTHERRKNNHMGRADPCLPE